MASGQIVEKKSPLEIMGGVSVKFQKHDGSIIEGVLTLSPAGEWEIVYVDPEFLRHMAQRRMVGSQITNSSIPTRKISIAGVVVTAITLQEVVPAM